MNEWLSKPPPGSILDPGFDPNKYCVLRMLFNEGAGQLVNDISPYRNNGLMMNMSSPPTATSGWNPGGIMFDSTNDNIICQNSPSLCQSSSISISITFFASTASPGVALIEKGLTTDYDYMLYINSTPSVNANYISAVGTFDYITYDFDFRNQLLTLVGTFSGGKLHLYLNGRQVNSKISAITNIRETNNNLTIGSGWFRYYNGIIDNVSIYNRALSAGEVAYLYQHKWADIWKPSNSRLFIPSGVVAGNPFMMGAIL